MDCYVSPDGTDTNDGTRPHPFATLTRARRAVRSTGKRPATVYLRGGLYTLTKPFRLGRADDGTTWRAYRNEEVLLRGCRTIPTEAFGPVTDPLAVKRLPTSARQHVLQVDLTALGIVDYGDPVTMGERPELFVGDQAMTLARWPNQGFVKVAGVLRNRPTKVYGGWVDAVGKLRYTGTRPTRWRGEIGTMRLLGYWCWDWAESYERIAKIDTARRVITCAEPYHRYGYRKGQRYCAVNLLCELDAPGEWYLDRERGVLYVYPPVGGAIDRTEVTLSMVRDPLVVLRGASHVTLRGLTFERTRGMAVRVTGGTGVRISKCRLRNTGLNAVTIDGGSDHGVTDCHIHDTGAGGVTLSGGNRRTLTPAGHFVRGCDIHDFSRVKRTYAAAVSLSGVGNRMIRNHICNAPHMAVAFSGNEHTIEYNDIHDVCRETGDVGVIYTGRDWTGRGTVIRYNFIHDVSGPGRWGAQAIYMDDAASGIIIRGNVLVRVQRAMVFGGGRDNIVENNLMVDCAASIDFDRRGLCWMAYHVQPGGIMPERLDAVPYRRPPWSTRYPQLLTLLEDRPGCPKGNVLRRNVAVRCGRMKLVRDVLRYGTVADNVETDAPIGLVDAGQLGVRLEGDALLRTMLPGFKPLPLAKIAWRGSS